MSGRLRTKLLGAVWSRSAGPGLYRTCLIHSCVCSRYGFVVPILPVLRIVRGDVLPVRTGDVA